MEIYCNTLLKLNFLVLKYFKRQADDKHKYTFYIELYFWKRIFE